MEAIPGPESIPIGQNVKASHNMIVMLLHFDLWVSTQNQG